MIKRVRELPDTLYNDQKKRKLSGARIKAVGKTKARKEAIYYAATSEFSFLFFLIFSFVSFGRSYPVLAVSFSFLFLCLSCTWISRLLMKDVPVSLQRIAYRLFFFPSVLAFLWKLLTSKRVFFFFFFFFFF
jgi:hypothetical protein